MIPKYGQDVGQGDSKREVQSILYGYGGLDMDSTCIIVLLVIVNINITLVVCVLSKVLNKLKDIDNRLSLIQFHSYGNGKGGE